MPVHTYKSWKILIVIISFYLIFFGLKLYQNNFDLSGFILIGDTFVVKESIQNNLTIIPNSSGFDGQFYYRLAINPFTTQRSKDGITLDKPSLRQQRVIYPLLSWVLVLGNKNLIPLSLFLINIFALIGLTILSLKLTKNNKFPWLGIILPLYPTFLIATSRDLTDVVSACFLLGGYYLYTKNKNYLAAIIFTIAALARETTIILPSVLAIFSLFSYIKNKNKKYLLKLIIFSTPLITFAIWQIILYLIWGQFPLSASYASNITAPFKDLILTLDFNSLNGRIMIVEICYLFGVIILSSLVFKKIRDWPLKITWILYLVLFSLYSRSIWIDDFTFFRSFTELFIFSFIMIEKSNNKKVEKILFFSTLTVSIITMMKIFIIGHLPETIMLIYKIDNIIK